FCLRQWARMKNLRFSVQILSVGYARATIEVHTALNVAPRKTACLQCVPALVAWRLFAGAETARRKPMGQQFKKALMNIEKPEISLVIPCCNEAGNLQELSRAIRAAVEPLQISYEVVITDDCSRDESWEILKELAASDPRIRVQRLAVHLGKSAA